MSPRNGATEVPHPGGPATHDPPADSPSGLDELVVRVASRLMPARHDTAGTAVADTLRVLQEYFGVDTVFLRRHDHERRMSVLVDECPRREPVPEPDPLGEVPFDSDAVWRATEHLGEPFIQRPRDSPASYQERVREASGVEEVSLAVVPLCDEEQTTGVLGFIAFGDRPWSEREVGALRAIASLLAQMRARTEAEEQLHVLASYDALTGLPNRRLLFPELQRRQAAHRTSPAALLFIDLDNHKDVNDVLGHRAGDEVLVTVAERLQAACRPDDFVARFGGDEFVVLLDGFADEESAREAATRLVRLATAEIRAAGQLLRRTVSAGVALSVGTATADELLADADAALHRAKTDGRDQVVVFDDALRAETVARRDLQIMLRRAIDRDELRLHYQPEIDLHTGAILGVEALVRWQHPRHGLLPADAFIEVAESSGMILDIGRWVMVEASRQAAEWHERIPGLDAVVRVNVSPLQLRNRDLLHTLAQCRAHGPLRGRLSLELTEHAVLQDVDHAVSVIREVRNLGVSVALDDFGTGQSSLSQLKRLPVDFLKIDRSFVRDLGTDPADRAVVDAMADLARAFDLSLIAEGIETHRHIAQLLEVGCRRGQGFLFSHPRPAHDLDPMLADGALPLPTRSRRTATAAIP
ncbi:EAL domain-containing protein [Egibacter rhizosphaerae]|uniref:EAL domain-containing protein n=1 Tax=Egibacter rhizosphaerae TaxID=1670831 RepID=A0A411YIS6_9ACTN|nr:EAL domain-containing protein [Egibacter rhizosphaerae]QBI20982.1 EAL domain-containing protein [Egibacter rhizosphaerae]